MKRSKYSEDQIAFALPATSPCPGLDPQRIFSERGLPRTIKTDNGSEFISKVMDKWAYERGVEMDFQPTRQADRQCTCGKLQRAPTPGVSERPLVSFPG